ncbi:MAG TPA: hypothetical protein VK196_09315 [Magnetospirillum sp.]|nr:hypothetical protein [Magnetospirillum sp.]
MEYEERLRLEGEKHRLALEHEQAREAERMRALAEDHQTSVELARIEIEAAPIRAATALTDLFAGSVARQHESFGQTLNTILDEEMRQGAAMTENLLGRLTDIVQTKLAHQEAARQREHERAMAIIAGQLSGAQQAANHRHEATMAHLSESRAAADHGRAMEATAHSAKVDVGKYAEQKILDFVLWLQAREWRATSGLDMGEDELLQLWRKFESEENA